jgi:hypothetical protein
LGDLPYSCGSPLKLAPAGGLRLPVGKHADILTGLQTQVNKKIKNHRKERGEINNI